MRLGFGAPGTGKGTRRYRHRSFLWVIDEKWQCKHQVWQTKGGGGKKMDPFPKITVGTMLYYKQDTAEPLLLYEDLI